MSDLKICLAPIPIVWGNKGVNLDTLKTVMEGMHPETDILILPETFSTGFPSGMDKERVRPMAERNTGLTIDYIKALAKQHNVAVAGSFIADSGGSLYNRAFFIEPNGEETFADKRHLFTMVGEHNSFSYGRDRLKVRYRGWNIAMIVCYDLRFPVWCRNVDNEYDLLISVANWPTVRVDAWRKLLMARAIENEAYVCGVDCNGADTNGIEYDGSSMAIDFKGNDITVRGNSVSLPMVAMHHPDCSPLPLLYATLSKEKLDRFRTKFPAWQDADRFRLQ